MNQQYDIVIVGTGIGGLCTLLYLTETPVFKKGALSICLITKDKINTTNTDWAQGGIAAVHAIDDSFDQHIKDTLIAGAFTNDKYIVEKVVKAAPAAMDDLIKWGTIFDKNEVNEFNLAKEGGHSHARIWHQEDQTGHSIQYALIQKLKAFKNIEVFENYTLLDARIPNDTCFNLQLYNNLNNNVNSINCKKLVLATGGLGMLYTKTTNQKVATGDGIYIANKLGAAIENLSYVQFHPTGLNQEGNITFLITEALRGAGAILRNKSGEAFMAKYDQRLELAPRDIVSRAIITEIDTQKSNNVFLDATVIHSTVLNTHFPKIKSSCKELLNIDIEKDWIPVVPVQHYSCGGIKVNEYGASTVNNLFAIGEVASTGLHGANRLASNSLLEAITFAKFATEKLIEDLAQIKFTQQHPPHIPDTFKIDKKQIQNIISEYAGIIKTSTGLDEAMRQLLEIKQHKIKNSTFNLDDFEAGIMLEVAILLIQDAQNQNTNKGVFYNKDFV
jgi:L-aspartate oxidase